MTREEILEQLDKINKEIDSLIKKRTEFMDAHMDEASKEFHVGDEYVNVSTHEKVTERELYRDSTVYNSNGDYKDNSLYTIHARFSNGDNTSRYGYTHPYCRKEDYDARNQKYIWKLEDVSRWKALHE